MLKRITILLLVLVLICCAGGYFYIQSFKPTLEGELKLQGLNEEVEVYFDTYGIPHIYAESEEDAQFALGYVHAQDRLFQMEMIRRLGNGELAEILGTELVESDRFFRTLGTKESAIKASKAFIALDANNPMKKAATAYYDGINSYIENGKLPIEYQILGIEARPFSIHDGYAIFGYMAFSFAQAFRTDPLLMRIHDNLGVDYLNDLDVHWNPTAQKIPFYSEPSIDSMLSDVFDIKALFQTFPTPPFIGSNSWVIGPKKTKSGKVIFSNDTHIGFSQPSVWYEAHLNYPDANNYGFYLAGVPFSVMGHNDHLAIGITMLENDDIDFYVEKQNPDNANQVWFKDKWEDLDIRTETIKVKDGNDVSFEVKVSRHGPIINDALEHVSNTTDQPVSVYWIYNEFMPTNLESAYLMGRAQNLEDIKSAVSLGAAPGLNIMYGDVEGNIAWFSMGKLALRPDHVNSKLFLDGASGLDEILGYVDFEDNPHSINPPAGYVYSANNQPESEDGTLHPGYYIPEDRARRIMEVLEKDNEWDIEKAKVMINDVKSLIAIQMSADFVSIIGDLENGTANEKQALAILSNWDGNSELNDIEPTIYIKMLYHFLEKTFKDDLGEKDFESFLHTHIFKRTYPFLIQNENSKWWDNAQTKESKENRKEIITAAFRQSITELETQLGTDISQWNWSKVHTIEHPHPLSKVESLRKFFNVGPFPVNGNMEVLNNMMFPLNGEGKYEVYGGPAKRRVIDFNDLNHSVNVLPTGQSGNVMSPHYSDQAQMFVDGEFRLQLYDKAEIVEAGKLLKMIPE